MASKKKEKQPVKNKSVKRKSRKKGFLYYFWNYFLKWFFYLIGWLAVKFWSLLKLLFRKTSVEANKTKNQAKKLGGVYGELTSGAKKSDIRVVESIKGSYQKFWKDLRDSDSRIGIVVGTRGSGKSAIALTFLENLRSKGRKFFALGFPSKELPNWIKVVETIEELENDSYVVVDEGGILFSSRNAMSASNKMLSELLFIARHKNLTIIFISQNSSNLEINTLRQADFIVLKKSSLLQKNFERKIVSDIYEEYQQKFVDYSNIRGIALIYSSSFVGFIDNDLPSFWSTKISKSYSEVKKK